MFLLLLLLGSEKAPYRFGDNPDLVVLNHITRPNAGFTTTLLIENVSSSAKSIVLRPFTVDGYAQETIPINLNAGKLVRISDFNAGDYAVWNDEPGMRFLVEYAHSSGGGSPAHMAVLKPTDFGSSFTLFPGNWDVHFDGLTVVNQDVVPVNISLEQVGYDGLIYASAHLGELRHLHGGQKAVFLLGSPDSAIIAPRPDTYYRIHCTGLVSMMAIRGNVPGRSDANLWGVSLMRPDILDAKLIEISTEERFGDDILFFTAEHYTNWIAEFTVQGPNGGLANIWHLEREGNKMPFAITQSNGNTVELKVTLFGAKGESLTQTALLTF